VVRVGVAVPPGLVDEQPDPPGERVVVGHDESALAGRDVLALLEAEAADRPQRAHEPSGALGEERLGAVLDHRDALAVGERRDRRHVHRVAEQVGDDDPARALGEAVLDGLRGDVERDRVDVREDRDRTLVEDGREGAHVRDRRRDELVARLGVDRGDRRVHRRGPRVAGDRVLRTDAARELLLELARVGALRAGQHPAADNLLEQIELFGPERAPRSVLIRGQPHRFQLSRLPGSRNFR
jgi:hypothetical protein